MSPGLLEADSIPATCQDICLGSKSQFGCRQKSVKEFVLNLKFTNIHDSAADPVLASGRGWGGPLGEAAAGGSGDWEEL